MHQKCGTLAMLVDKSTTVDTDEEVLTVEDATEFLKLTRSGEKASPLMSHTRVKYLLSRIKPYATLLPGTSLYMEDQQKKLLSMVNSPLTTSMGSWIYFLTMVLGDSYSPLIYDNLVTSTEILLAKRNVDFTSTISDRRAAADSFSQSERNQLLCEFPGISARIFALHQDAFFNIILKGYDNPLGKVLEVWRRIEFQGRGTPHSHNLLNIEHNGILENSICLPPSPTDEDIAKLEAILNEVSTVITARLQPRGVSDEFDLPLAAVEHEIYKDMETKRSFNFDKKSFKHQRHPGLDRFSCLFDYSYDKVRDVIFDPEVQVRYRRRQLHNQFHYCTFTCFVYCKPGKPRVCRFRFSKIELANNEYCTVINDFTDHRKKKENLLNHRVTTLI